MGEPIEIELASRNLDVGLCRLERRWNPYLCSSAVILSLRKNLYDNILRYIISIQYHKYYRTAFIYYATAADYYTAFTVQQVTALTSQGQEMAQVHNKDVNVERGSLMKDYHDV